MPVTFRVLEEARANCGKRPSEILIRSIEGGIVRDMENGVEAWDTVDVGMFFRFMDPPVYSLVRL